jgi:hypothetical protein
LDLERAYALMTWKKPLPKELPSLLRALSRKNVGDPNRRLFLMTLETYD